MPMSRVMEALFYSLVNYIAYIPLVVYPFRNRMRFSKTISGIIIAVLCVGFFIMTLSVMNGMPAYLIPVITILVTAIVMKVGIQQHIGKTMMTFLIEYNNASFVCVMAKALENVFFANRVHMLYGWTHSIFILLGVIVVYLIDGWYSEKVYNDIILIPDERKYWNYIWLTPFSYFIIWFMYIYTDESYINGTPEQLSVLALLVLFSLCSFITYYTIIQMAFSEQENERLVYQEKLQQQQFQNMNRRIEETRKVRHDLRHHLVVIRSLVDEGDCAAVYAYLDQLMQESAQSSIVSYCTHHATNALLSHYAYKAKEAGIAFDVKCNLPGDTKFTDRSLTIIFGNLLENALTACQKMEKGPKKIIFHCQYEHETMFLLVKNTTDRMPVKDTNGQYLSTSHEGHGIGVESVRSVVAKHNGQMHDDCKDGYFTVSIVMAETEQKS